MGIPKYFSKEEVLEFDDIRFGSLNVFSLSLDHTLTRDEAIEALFKVWIKAEWPPHIEKMFKIPEDFLTKKIASQHFRLKLEDFDFSYVRKTKKLRRNLVLRQM